jgi:hypothetical protein
MSWHTPGTKGRTTMTTIDSSETAATATDNESCGKTTGAGWWVPFPHELAPGFRFACPEEPGKPPFFGSVGTGFDGVASTGGAGCSETLVPSEQPGAAMPRGIASVESAPRTMSRFELVFIASPQLSDQDSKRFGRMSPLYGTRPPRTSPAREVHARSTLDRRRNVSCLLS